MILSGRSLRRCVGMIQPFMERTSHKSGLTYGVGPAGYDVRIAEHVLLAPGGFMLASILEKINMPDDLVGIVHDKSTWARRGLALQNTVVEPGWRGYLTIELSNHGRDALEIMSGMPIAQIVFHRTDVVTEPYEGRYQDQPAGPQPAIMTTGTDSITCPCGEPWQMCARPHCSEGRGGR